MNLFTWMRIFIRLKRVQFLCRRQLRNLSLIIQVADDAVAREPTNERYLKFQREAHAAMKIHEASTRALLADAENQLSDLKTFRF